MESTGSYKTDDLDALDATELRLGLPGTTSSSESVAPAQVVLTRGTKRSREEDQSSSSSACTQDIDQLEPPSSPPKMLVVGWPPVRTFRRNSLQPARKAQEEEEEKAAITTSLVKVSMDGAPYLRKIDLNAYNGYRELKKALDVMFQSYSVGSLHYTITYEDRDGDWMLAGDVPWGMFSSSCKRLRLARGSESVDPTSL